MLLVVRFPRNERPVVVTAFEYCDDNLKEMLKS